MDELTKNLKAHREELESLLEKMDDHWGTEDFVYRLYHYSFKTYWAQQYSVAAKELFDKIAPEGCGYSSFFEQIYEDGTGIEFGFDHNEDWLRYTRPIIECYFHCNYFVREMVKAARMNQPFGSLLNSGCAAILCLYKLR